MTWQRHDERQVGRHLVLRLRAAHSHEAAHDVAVHGQVLRVLPDGRTTARKRSDIISEVLTGHADNGSAREILDSLVGALVIAGATALELDGTALLPTSDRRGQWRVVLNDDGTVAATYLGDTT